jgi:hypothetical protein
MEIFQDVEPCICVSEMKNGQIAVITEHPVSGYVGTIVQRVDLDDEDGGGSFLFTVGGFDGIDKYDYWGPEIFNRHDHKGDVKKPVRVRVLPKGTLLKIT